MTKKDYELIARAINVHAWNEQGLPTAKVVIGIADTIAEELARENTRFDRVRFLDACFKK